MAKAPQGHGTGLNDKQARFVEEYLIDLNATQAAIRAGYSAKSAEVQGCKLLRVPKIARFLAARQDERAQDVGITQARVLRELALLSFSDVTHYEVDDQGKVVLTETAPKGAQRAISSIKRKIFTDKDGNVTREVELRLWNKPDPLKLAGRHVGLFSDNAEPPAPPVIHIHTGMVTPPELTPSAAPGPETTTTLPPKDQD